MKKPFLSPLALVVFLLLVATSGWAQSGSVKGVAKDQAGQPLGNAQVIFKNKDNGRTIKLKTNKAGEYFSLGLDPGTYQVTLLSKDGQPLTTVNEFRVKLQDDPNGLDLIAGGGTPAAGTAAAAAEGQAPPPQPSAEDLKKMSAEQRKQIEEIDKKNVAIMAENAKIRGLNAMLKEAADDMNANNFDGAVSVMQQATQADPSRDVLWGRLGDAQLGAKKYDDAIGSYQKAIQLNSASPKASLPLQGAWSNNMGQSLAKENKVPDAEAAYEVAAKDDPAKAGMYYYNEGAILTNSGKTDEANVAFDKAIAADPNQADAYYQKGVNQLAKATLKGTQLVAPPGTEEALQKYLELLPEGPHAESAKELLEQLNASVQTTFKQPAATKKK